MKQKLKSFSKHRYIRAACEIAQQIFVVLLVTYLLLLLAETVWEESASSVLNLNYLLIAVIVVGIPAVLAGGGGKPEEAEKQPLGLKDAAVIACAAIAGAVIVWIKTKDIGWPSAIMSIISCALIVILSLLILKGEDEGKKRRHK